MKNDIKYILKARRSNSKNLTNVNIKEPIYFFEVSISKLTNNVDNLLT